MASVTDGGMRTGMGTAAPALPRSPLPRSHAGRSAALTLLGLALAAGYCLAHDWFQGLPGDAGIALRWGLASVLPWGAVWLAVGSLPQERGWPRALGLALLCLGGMAMVAAARSLAMADIAEPSLPGFMRQLHTQLPVAGLVALAGWWLGRETSDDARPLAPAQPFIETAPQDRPEPTSEPAPLLDLTRADGSRVSAAEIDWVGSAGNYVEVHLPGGALLWRRPLREVEAMLAPHGFLRVHRTALVARDRVLRLEGAALLLRCGTRIAVGRNHRSAVRAALG
ncbi:MAG TPA: LytTR family DNA-binding domain-containing protein [Azospirillaceae bacterium]|nr:LytTR family DNA-binding domain-containing protein [Azospirillaceae bacterium]